MKVYGKWLVMQQGKNGNKAIVTHGNTKKECAALLDMNAPRIDSNLWGNEDSTFWIEKNTKEYK